MADENTCLTPALKGNTPKGYLFGRREKRRKRRCPVAESVVAPPVTSISYQAAAVAAGGFETLKHKPSPWENTRVIVKPCQANTQLHVFSRRSGKSLKIYEKKKVEQNSCIIHHGSHGPHGHSRFTGLDNCQ